MTGALKNRQIFAWDLKLQLKSLRSQNLALKAEVKKQGRVKVDLRNA